MGDNGCSARIANCGPTDFTDMYTDSMHSTNQSNLRLRCSYLLVGS